MAFAPTTAPTQSPFHGFAARMRHFFARQAAYRQTSRELSALSDRELNDIGLSRYDIHRIAMQSADMV